MDYTLAALKLMCAQLKQAKQTPSQSSFSFGGILFQRAWVQGLLVSVSDSDENDNCSRFLLDDGTGIVELLLSQDFLNQNHWITGTLLPLHPTTFPFSIWPNFYCFNNLGMYVMVVGAYIIRADEIPMIKVQFSALFVKLNHTSHVCFNS